MIGFPGDKPISIDKYYTIYTMKLSEKHFSGNEIYSFWELIYVLDGELNCTAGNNIYNLKKNSMILFPPNEFHTLGVEEGKFAEIFILSFSICGCWVNKLKSVPFSLTETLKTSITQIIDFCVQNSGQHFKDYYCEHSFAFDSNPLFLGQICALTEFFLLSLCDATPTGISPVTNSDTALFSAVTKTMQKYYNCFFTINQLSEMHNISPTKLKSLIKKYTAVSLHQYYMELKLSRAVQLFKAGYNINETSNELGFCNPNHFSNVFKKKTGVTPSQYIRSLR